jgi:DNA-binding transcriptional MocR family regulator
VLSIGSFSKILAPGLRVGWIQAHEKLTTQLGLTGLVGSAGSLNHFASNIVTSVLSLGLQEQYLTTLKEIYGRRIDLMDRLLSDHFGSNSLNVYTKPAGGFFFWLTLNKAIDTRELLKKAQSLKTGFVPGASFSISQNFTNCLRLSFAFYDEAEIEQGMTRLLSVLPKG